MTKEATTTKPATKGRTRNRAEVEIVNLTKTEAKRLATLPNSERQRPLNEADADAFAKVHEAGDWILGDSAIVIRTVKGEDASIENGQHRIHGRLRSTSSNPCPIMVLRLPDMADDNVLEHFLAFDGGKARSLGSYFKALGVENYQHVSSTSGLLYQLHQNSNVKTPKRGGRVPVKKASIAAFWRDEVAQDTLQMAISRAWVVYSRTNIPLAWVAASIYTYHRAGYGHRINEFWDRVNDRQDAGREADPDRWSMAHLLAERTDFWQVRKAKGEPVPSDDRWCIVVACIRGFMRGERATIVRATPAMLKVPLIDDDFLAEIKELDGGLPSKEDRKPERMKK